MDRRPDFARLRARYLAAMGVPLVAAPAVFFAGCERSGGLVSAPTSHGETASIASSTPDASAGDDDSDAAASVKRSYDPPEPVPPSFAHTVSQECSTELAAPQPPELPSPFDACPRRWNDGQFSARATRAERSAQAEACCYVRFRVRPMLGRALRDGDREARAPLAARGDWLAHASDLLARSWDSVAHESARAAQLRDDARAEHASVAAFARLSLDLLELGAPPELIAEAHRAALDEIEHAKIAFAIAERIDGRALGPGPLSIPPRTRAMTVAELVREAIVDGAYGEGVAAIVARRASDDARDPTLHALLARVADDEERHAALAYRTLAWALAAFGDPARTAAAEALSSIAIGDGRDADRELRAAVLSSIVEPCVASAIAAARAAAA